MTTKNNTEEIVETTEVIENEAVEQVEVELTEAGFFGKVGSKLDRGVSKVKNFRKRNGKKIAKTAGIVAGGAAALVGTAIVVDTMERAKALTDGTDALDDVIETENLIDTEDPTVAEYIEAEAAVA